MACSSCSLNARFNGVQPFNGMQPVSSVDDLQSMQRERVVAVNQSTIFFGFGMVLASCHSAGSVDSRLTRFHISKRKRARCLRTYLMSFKHRRRSRTCNRIQQDGGAEIDVVGCGW